ncbi:MAG: DUF881 domain-containing protein [Acetivibrionales bacterium]|nr:DUF881 domain-containing protein [Clostridiales bacterium]HQD30724.1 DUF881 domain-containing protein [Clostridiales bacterium]
MKKPASRYILFIVFILLGMVTAWQLKSTLNARKATASSALNANILREQIAELRLEIDELRTAIDENIALQNDIIKEYIALQNDDQLSREWEIIKLHTGLVGVEGAGITITLDDAPVREPGMPPSWFIIHDYDIRTILNELKTAGAQAIAINGERVVPMSEQICAGPTIIINDNRYPVPYIIEAIGEPDGLYEAMSTSNKVAELKEFNILVDIKKSDKIRISKFSGADKLDRYISGLEVVEK